MVSNFGLGWQKVPCYLSKFKAFIPLPYLQYLDEAVCGVLVQVLLMQLYFLHNMEPLFIPLQREDPLIHVLHNQLSELIRTIMMRFLKQSVVGEKTGRSTPTAK